MYNMLKKICLKAVSLVIIAVLPIMLYVYIQDDVHIAWNVNDVNDINKYIMKVNVDSENKEIYLEEIVEYINKAENELDKMYFYILSQASITDSLCSELKNDVEGTNLIDTEPYLLDIKSISSNGKELNYKIIGRNENIVRVNLSRSIQEGEKVEIDIKGVLVLPRPTDITDNSSIYEIINWYPVIADYNEGWMLNVDRNYIEKVYSREASFDVEIVASDEVDVTVTGKLIDKYEKKGKLHLKYESPNFSCFTISIE